MSFTAQAIRGREAILNRLLMAGSPLVLNAGELPQSRLAAQQAVEVLKRLIDEIKSEAYDLERGGSDYERVRRGPLPAALRSATAHLRAIDLAALGSQEQRLAFWINLYNVLVVDGVLSLGIRHSVREGWLGGLGFFRRVAYDVGGLRFSCDDIEHGILRANRGLPYLPGAHFAPADQRRAYVLQRRDPRIHFALNCGARSCPPIRLYEPAVIDSQLERAARSFIDADIRVRPERKQLQLSAIFRWYSDDFAGRAGVIDVLLRYLPDDRRRHWLLEHRRRVRMAYRPYDWSLA